MKSRLFLALAAATLALLVPGLVRADGITLPDYQATAILGGAIYNVPSASYPSLPLSVSLNEPNEAGSQSDTATITGGLAPSIYVTASGTGNNIFANGDLEYYFMITGPATTESIPVLFNGTTSSEISLSGGNPPGSLSVRASSAVTVNDVTTGTQVDSEASQTSQTTFNRNLSLTVGDEYFVVMGAGVNLMNFQDSGEPYAAESFVDPSFTIDPSFADAGLYTINYSPGLISSAATPEPSSLPVLGLMFLGWLTFGVRKRAAQQA